MRHESMMGRGSQSYTPNGQFTAIGRDVSVGENTAIWNLVFVGHAAKIGSNVVIGSLSHIGDGCEIGDRTQVSGSVYLAQGTRVGRDCFIGPGAVFTDDPFPPVRRVTGVTAWVGVVVEDGAVIGAGARIRAGIVIGRRAVVGMGAVVLHDVPAETVVVGSPARRLYSRAEYDRRQQEWADLSRAHDRRALSIHVRNTWS